VNSSSYLLHPVAKPLYFFICLLPFGWIIGNAFVGDLGANPVETITHQTGDWTLRFLILTLFLTPLKNWTGISQFIRYRRMTGLFVYFYASCHFLIWFLADHALDVNSMIEDIIKRPYITIGFSAFLLLTPLALTSNKWSMKKLARKWKTLHQLVYVIITLGVIHFLWLVKADYLEPMIYAVIVLFLLLIRLDRFKWWGEYSTG
jgi:sulfoxide reductase heme-binding subunit YedZ